MIAMWIQKINKVNLSVAHLFFEAWRCIVLDDPLLP